MWPLTVLIGLNALAWGLPLATNLNAHLTPIGSYPFWWYDDLPLAALALSVIVPLVTLPFGAWRHPAARRAMTTIAAISLRAFLPWGCMAGAGM